MRKLLVFILILISIKGLAQYDSIKISTPNSGVGDNLRTAGGKMNAVITHLNTIQIYNISQPEMAILNGALASTAEINHLVGVTSPVQTQLNARAPLASPTFTGTVVLPATTSIGTVSNTELAALDGVTGVEEGVSMVEWNNGIEDNYLKALQAAGSSIKVGSAMGFYPRVDHTLYDGKALWTLFYLSDTTDITGVGYMLSTQGDYTADNYNGFAIYSVSGTTYTKIDSTANDGNLWKAAANTAATKAFSSGAQELNPGIYYIFLVYNNSAQVTAPKLYYNNDLANAAFAGITGTNKIQGVVNSQTTPPITETGGDVTADAEIPAIWLY